MERRAFGRGRRPGPRRPRRPIPRRHAVAAVAVACLALAPAAAGADAALEFSAPVPDTILDGAGLGTGFTRVIADGGLVPEHLALLPGRGLLLVTSTAGDAARGGRPGPDQENALSVRAGAGGTYTVEATLVGPLLMTAPGQAAGIYVGTGQGAYVRASVSYHAPADAEPGLRLGVASEGAESGRGWRRGVAGLGEATAIVLRLQVDPATGSVRASARVGGAMEPIDPTGAPVVLDELEGPAPAVTAGIITTQGDSGVPFTVAYDRFVLDGPPEVRLSAGSTFRDGAPRAQVIATFSEPMDTASVQGALALLDPAAAPVPAAVTVSADRRSAVLDPLVELAPAAAYTAVIGASAADDAGNPLAAPAHLVLTPALRAPAGSPPATGEPGASPRASGAPLCAAVAEPAPARPLRRRPVPLAAEEMLVTQRLAQAALRRANAIEAWLDAGLTTDDLCGGGLGADVLGPGIVTGGFAPGAAPAPARPRPLAPARGRAPRPAAVVLSARQLLVGQRIAQAALRRVAALERRLDAGLTGGDLRDGAVTAAKLAPGLGLVSARPVTDPPPATRTAPAAPLRHRAGRLELSAAQLTVNRRIAQAAVRRANALTRRLERGLTGADFQPGSITAADLEPSLRRP
jgi:hypothetical protein